MTSLIRTTNDWHGYQFFRKKTVTFLKKIYAFSKKHSPKNNL